MKTIMKLPAMVALLILIIFILELLLPGNFTGLGIRPRRLSGLPGVFLSPLLHANLTHLASNLLPLLVMSFFVSALAPSRYLIRTFVLIAISGGLTWLISSSGVVVGASGLVFAYWSFLITNGFFTRRTKDVFIALVTFLLYGAMIFSLFRLQQGISWAGHFSGAIAGILLALYERRANKLK